MHELAKLGIRVELPVPQNLTRKVPESPPSVPISRIEPPEGEATLLPRGSIREKRGYGFDSPGEKRPLVSEIKAWCEEYGAPHSRNRDGSYDALLELNVLGSWEMVEAAAGQAPMFCMLRFVGWFAVHEDPTLYDELQKYREDKQGGHIESRAPQTARINSRWIRGDEWNKAMLSIFGRGAQIIETRARLEVQWPATRK